MFYVDVAKVDLDIVMLHIFYTHVKNVLSRYCIFNERFEYSMQHEQILQRVFFIIINRRLATLFNIFLMFQIAVSMLQMFSFYVADVII